MIGVTYGGFCMAVNAINIVDLGEGEFYPQTNGEISDSITQNWTDQALECYRLKCDCSKCTISKGSYSFVCQMPKVLDALTKTLGMPSTKNLLKVID